MEPVEIIMIKTPDKPPEEPSSLRPLSLLSVMSTLFEELYYRRLMKTVDCKNVIPDH